MIKTVSLLILTLLTAQAAANQCVELMKKEDYYDASPVCEKMAKKGDVPAQYGMGILYYQGLGVMADKTQAIKWLRKAAENNHRVAQYNLGILIAIGQGALPDLVEAFAWLCISA